MCKQCLKDMKQSRRLLVKLLRMRPIGETQGSLLHVESVNFLVYTVAFEKMLLLTKGLSSELQSKDLDIAAAVDLVHATLQNLTKVKKQ